MVMMLKLHTIMENSKSIFTKLIDPSSKMAESYCVTVISHKKDDEDILLGADKYLKNLEDVTIISERVLSSGKAIDYLISMEPMTSEKIRGFSHEEKEKGYDIIVQKSDGRKNKRLFVFDMDSTLIYQEVIELIAAYANIEDKVAEITERAMNGELDFKESLMERVSLLRGIDATTIWSELEEKLEITKGAKKLCKALTALDCIKVVCSGGFIPLASYLKDVLGLDFAFANQLGTDSNNKLNGSTIGEIVDGNKKAEILLEIANKYEVNLRDTVAVGDGANDLKMMSVAGLGIAWNAKPKVQKQAPCCLNTDSLADILYIMGYDDEEVRKLLDK